MEILAAVMSYEPLVNGLFLLVGALVAFLASSHTGRKGREAEDRRVWYDKISELYLDMTQHMDVFDRQHGLANGDAAFSALNAEMLSALETLDSGMTRLQLMCSPATVKAAKKYHSASKAIANKANALLNSTPDKNAAYSKAKSDLLNSIRRDLNITKPLVTLSK